MVTAPLKSFATWARTALIRETTARVAVVLGAASPERIEQPGAVAALEKAVAGAGGGEKGRTAVADRVAYTWFNRIIALRFMDANGYTSVGVVSPQSGIENGQPEILADAKRGVIDFEVVGTETSRAVTDLLNGTRRSNDAQGEAYALLLAEYCRHWNRSMPFMFERQGDYTELLIPANLLADDSVLSRAIRVLTPEVCEDVEVIGWLYQFYIEERHDEVLAGFKKNKRAGEAEIPAATQLFTPHWIVRYLVENSLGRLWVLNRPSSHLVDQMEYYIAPADDEADFLKINSPEELKVIDPACGSGHILTYAFDLLYAIYEEEGYAPSEIPGLILANNLYGVEIDPRAGSLAAFVLMMKGRARQRTFFSRQVQPNLCVLESIRFTSQELNFLLAATGNLNEEATFWNQFERASTFGSLIRTDPGLTARLGHRVADLDDDGSLMKVNVIEQAKRVVMQAEYLSGQYSIVVANPPYMGSGNMSPEVASWVREAYSDEKQDLYACFIVRSDQLALPGGLIALITGDTWMTIKSFENLRRRILRKSAFLSLVHMRDTSYHADTFGANTSFVLAKDGHPDRIGTFIYLDAANSEKKASDLRVAVRNPGSPRTFLVQGSQFEQIPGAPLAFRISDSMRRAFRVGRPLLELAEPRQGMATADNGRFTRMWFEVSHDKFGRGLTRPEAASSSFKWFPYNKGGEYRKWYGNQSWVINWQNDGAELFAERPKAVIRSPQLYFLPSVSWSKIGIGVPAFRYYPKGFIFADAGMSIFAERGRLYQLAAICNSNVVTEMIGAISATLNAEVGTISQLPVLDVSEEAVDAARKLIEIHRMDWNSQESSWEFGSIDMLGTGGAVRKEIEEALSRGIRAAGECQDLEMLINREVARGYGLDGEIAPQVPLSEVTLNCNPVALFGNGKSEAEYELLYAQKRVRDLVSYAIGCLFGRYSLDEPGLILADQGSTLRDYLAKVPQPSFKPDKDNVIPIVDGDWFEDDIVARFREFLRVAFGEEHFEENMRFVTESLGVKDLRSHFLKSFYDDHVKRYKKRPIYWLFSSPKGSFNALIYLHRYTPSTVSTVLNEYLREYAAKLTASLQQQERLVADGVTPRQVAAAQKDADRLRKVLVELEEYEHNVLYPLASRQLAIDLDDGVKANYPKFGAALKKIPGLEAIDE